MEAKNNHIPWEHRGIDMAAKGGFHVVQMLQRNDSEKYEDGYVLCYTTVANIIHVSICLSRFIPSVQLR